MPTLCALNGGVYGGATDMALACDFRLGVKGMRFFMPAARFGLHYYPSGLRRYTQKVSPSFAKRAFLLSEDFTDEDLLRVGYLDWLVDRARVQGQGRRDRGQARRPGAAVDGQHEARHRAVRPGRARHPEDPRRHPRVPDLGGSARRPEPRCARSGRRPSRAAEVRFARRGPGRADGARPRVPRPSSSTSSGYRAAATSCLCYRWRDPSGASTPRFHADAPGDQGGRGFLRRIQPRSHVAGRRTRPARGSGALRQWREIDIRARRTAALEGGARDQRRSTS